MFTLWNICYSITCSQYWVKLSILNIIIVFCLFIWHVLYIHIMWFIKLPLYKYLACWAGNQYICLNQTLRAMADHFPLCGTGIWTIPTWRSMHGQTRAFTDNLNSLDQDMKVITEGEEDGAMAFLNTNMVRKECGSWKVTISTGSQPPLTQTNTSTSHPTIDPLAHKLSMVHVSENSAPQGQECDISGWGQEIRDGVCEQDYNKVGIHRLATNERSNSP